MYCRRAVIAKPRKKFVRWSSSTENAPPPPRPPRILPAEKASSKAWSMVVNKLDAPNLEGLYTLRTDAANPNLQYDRIRRARRKQLPHLVLMDLLVNRNPQTSKPPAHTDVDKALAVHKWDDFPEDIETVVTRLHDLRRGEELVIVGAGISGLSLAWFVAHARPDVKIKLLERTSSVGGYMASENRSETIFEHGPRTLLPSHPGTTVATHILAELGMLDQLVGVTKRSPTNTKGLVYNGQLVKLPSNGLEMLKFLFSPIMKGVKLAALKDLFWAKSRKKNIDDESVESFISRRLSKRLADRFVSAVMRGIYAGSISDLSSRSVARLNRLYLAERLHDTSIIGAAVTGIASAFDTYSTAAFPLLSQAMTERVYFGHDDLKSTYSLLAIKGGIQSLALRLEKSLTEKFGVKIVKNCRVEKIVPIDGGCRLVTTSAGHVDAAVVVSTVSAHEIGPGLVAATEAQKLAQEIKFANLAVINFHLPTKTVAKDWFGFLIPRTEDSANSEQVIGVIFDSSVRNSAVSVQRTIDERVKEIERDSEPEGFRPVGVESMSLKKLTSMAEIDKLKALLTSQFDDPDKPNSAKQPDTGTTLTVMMGGDLWSELSDEQLPSEQEVVDRAVVALNKYLNTDIRSGDYTSSVTFQTKSIPQYTIGHGDRVNAIHENVAREFDNRLYLSGMSFGRGVGVSDCIVDSLTIASRFSPQRKLLYPQFYVNNYLMLTHPSLYA
jgi:oxygen-dependent protoporphyrinogen oxidase